VTLARSPAAGTRRPGGKRLLGSMSDTEPASHTLPPGRRRTSSRRGTSIPGGDHRPRSTVSIMARHASSSPLREPNHESAPFRLVCYFRWPK
jgi:hypothetical protein